MRRRIGRTRIRRLEQEVAKGDQFGKQLAALIVNRRKTRAA